MSNRTRKKRTGRAKRARQPVLSTTRPGADKSIVSVTLDGEVTIYDPRKDVTHLLNEQASVIWSLCDGERTVDQIVDDVSIVYEVPTETVRDEFVRVVKKYVKIGVMQAS